MAVQVALRIDMTKPKPKDELQKRGRKSAFRPEYILIAKACARFGAIEDEIANELNVGPATLDRWKQKYPEFRCALKAGKEASDDRVERSLYQLAIGWNGQPPNTTAAIFWLKNRRPDRWRDVQQLQGGVGHYLLSDRPLSEEEWIAQHWSRSGCPTRRRCSAFQKHQRIKTLSGQGADV